MGVSHGPGLVIGAGYIGEGAIGAPDTPPAFRLAASANIAAGAATATTQQLTGPGGKTFQSSFISDDTNPLPSTNPGTDVWLEPEWCFEPVSGVVVDGEQYEFAVFNEDDPLNAYVASAILTIGASGTLFTDSMSGGFVVGGTNPVTVAVNGSGNVTASGSGVLSWTAVASGSGNVSISGTVPPLLRVTASGAAVLAGTADVLNVKIAIASGGVVLAGAAPLLVALSKTGTFTLQGASIVAISVPSFGGMVLQGSAPPLVRIPMFGGAALSGAALLTIKPSATGGVALSGQAAPTLTVVASGTATVGGSSPTALTSVVTAAGTVQLGGTAGVGTIQPVAGSGTFTIGGAALSAWTARFTNSGAVVLSGTEDSRVSSLNEVMSGGFVLSGTGLSAATFTLKFAGGASLSGSAALSIAPGTSGGAVLSGQALPRISVVGSGAVNVAGSAGAVMVYTVAASGSVAVAGQAGVMIQPSASGSVVVSGSGSLALRPGTQGGVSLGGTAGTSTSFTVAASGGVTVTGASPAGMVLTVLSTGGIVLGGAAAASVIGSMDARVVCEIEIGPAAACLLDVQVHLTASVGPIEPVVTGALEVAPAATASIAATLVAAAGLWVERGGGVTSDPDAVVQVQVASTPNTAFSWIALGPLEPDVVKIHFAHAGDVNRAFNSTGELPEDQYFDLPEGHLLQPAGGPYRPAFERLADKCAVGSGVFVWEAEAGGPDHHRYALDLWISDEAECRRRIDLHATMMGWVRARQGGIQIALEHACPAPTGFTLETFNASAELQAKYAQMLAYETAKLSPYVDFVVVTVFIPTLDTAAWRAVVDFFGAHAATQYPGKPIVLMTNHLLTATAGQPYVGDAVWAYVIETAREKGWGFMFWPGENAEPSEAALAMIGQYV